MRRQLVSPKLIRANLKKTNEWYFFKPEKDFDFDEKQEVFIQYYPKSENYIESEEYLDWKRILFNNWDEYLSYLNSISKK